MTTLSKLGLAAALLCAAASLIGCDETTESHAADLASNSCSQNWHVCKDNTDLMNNYKELIHWRVGCMMAAKEAARFGEPTFPSHYFSSFHGKGDYVGTGFAVLIEPDARYQNGFGAMAHSHVECTYDIAGDKVTNIEVDGN
jgi:hypothetical protein